MAQPTSGSWWGQDPTRTQRAPKPPPPPPGSEIARMYAEQATSDEERKAYEEQIGALRAMQAGQEQRFAEARAPQVAAVEALGAGAQSLAGGAAVARSQASREAAQADAVRAQSAVLGGALGTVAAQNMPALEQEAAQRQAAYMRGLQALGGGLVTEAEARRLTEQELMRDMQIRFAAAQRVAAAQRERTAQERQQQEGAFYQLAGTALGAMVGGPGGAAAGQKLGSRLGGG